MSTILLGLNGNPREVHSFRSFILLRKYINNLRNGDNYIKTIKNLADSVFSKGYISSPLEVIFKSCFKSR